MKPQLGERVVKVRETINYWWFKKNVPCIGGRFTSRGINTHCLNLN